LINYFAYWLKRLLAVISICLSLQVAAQQKGDTLSKEVPVSQLNKIADTLNSKKVDSVIKVHSPHKAIIRSAIIPGWGQIYNKKYWKVPIVYAALGTSAWVFFDNLKWYHRSRYAFKVLYTKDSANFPNVYKDLQPYLTSQQYVSGLRELRDGYRQYVDYSVLVFVLLWGLNVADAAVDAHLKSFDVSPDLTLNFKVGHSEMANTNGVSLVLSFK